MDERLTIAAGRHALTCNAMQAPGRPCDCPTGPARQALLSRFTALLARLADLEAERDIAVAGMEELDKVASRARLRLHGAESRLAQAEAQLARVEARSRAARDAASEERCHAVCDVQGWLDEGTDAAKRKILDTVGWLVDHRYEDLYDLRAQLAAATARADQVARDRDADLMAILAWYNRRIPVVIDQARAAIKRQTGREVNAAIAIAEPRVLLEQYRTYQSTAALRGAAPEGPAGTEEVGHG